MATPTLFEIECALISGAADEGARDKIFNLDISLRCFKVYIDNFNVRC